MKIFCFDDDLSRSENTKLSPGLLKKQGVILDAPIGIPGGHITIFPSPIIKLPDGGYRMYYSIYTLTKSYDMKIGVAYSEDSTTWTHAKFNQVVIDGAETPYLKINGLSANDKIIQPNVILLPTGLWRMYFWLHGSKIRFVCAESDNGLDWTTINLDSPCLYHPMDETVREYFGNELKNLMNYDLERSKSRKGLTAESILNIKKLISNDATNVYFNSKTNSYVMFSVWLLNNKAGGPHHVAHDNAPDILRVIHRRTSKNGLEWSAPELVVVPDEKDPADLQFYYMSVECLDKWQIGFLGHYLCDAQTMDVEICLSRDGHTWSRPVREPWLSRGDTSAHDSMGIYSAANLVHKESESIYYYTAYMNTHNAFLKGEPVHSSIMAATFRKDRFLGLSSDTNKQDFNVKTKALILSQCEIIINADIKGSLVAQLSEPFGLVIPGFEYSNCNPIKGDSCRHVLTWKSKTLDELIYKGVILELRIDSGVIYSIEL